MKRIHIIGSSPRTGTTLLAEAMKVGFNIDRTLNHEASISNLNPPDGQVFLTKKPDDYLKVKWPLRLYRALYVICIVRDPRDSIVSFNSRQPGTYWTSLKSWKAFVTAFDEIETLPRFLWFRYEDFVTNPDRVQDLIAEHLPFLTVKHRFSQYHHHAQPDEGTAKDLNSVRPIAPAGVGAWKNHLPRVKQQIAVHGSITNDLIRFGYEADDSWETLLQSVEPGTFDSARSEFYTRRRLLKKRYQGLIAGIRLAWQHRQQ